MFAPMDENAGLMHHGIHDKENSSSFVVGGSRGLAGSGAGKNVLQPPSGRKALGNITNTTSKQQPGSSFGGAPEKGGKAAAPARRAFGVDITNSGALKQQQQPPGDPSSVKRKPLQALEPQQPPQTCSKQQLLPKSKAEVYAEGGVERLAGKSFREQEVDRLQREERDIDQRVKQLTSAMSMWKPQGISAHSDFEDDDLSGLSMTPSRLRPWSVQRRNEAAHSLDADDVPLLLPESPTAAAAGQGRIGSSSAAGLQQKAPFITILPDPELDLDFDELM